MTMNGSSANPVPHPQPTCRTDALEADAITRRGLLKALAATPLVGCWADVEPGAAGAATDRGQLDAGTTDPARTGDAAGTLEPEWVSAIPAVTFTQGTPTAYDLVRHTKGFNAGAHEMALASVSAPLAGGVTLDPAGKLTYDGVQSDASSSGIAKGTRPAPAAAGLVPFAARIASPGVVRHFGFDAPSQLGAGPGGFGYGHNFGWYPGADNDDHPVIDAAVFPGATGSSLRVTMDEKRGGGLWACNFSDDLKTRFNAGDEFFVQWRQRFNAAMLGPNVDLYGSWKQCLISSGDTDYTVAGVANSCRCIEICLTSYELPLAADDAHNDRFPIAYHRCPSCGGSVNLDESHAQQYLLLQNKRPAPYCGYNNIKGTGPGVAAPGGNCFTYVADEWMTFQIGVTCGARVGETLPKSRIRVWGQRLGRASELLIDQMLTLTFPSDDPGYGKFWITTRNPYKRNTTMVTWYAELIISRQRIADAL
jgi:hypothetical protein